MIPMRHSTIFKNRWWAGLWAAGILWFALDVAGGSDEAVQAQANNIVANDATGAPVTDEQARQMAQAINSI